MEEIEVAKEGKKKKGKKVAKRKLKKRSGCELSMMTSIARDLTSDHDPRGLGVPTITVEETRSQPGSRRASVFDMINMSKELVRRDSEVVTELEVVKNGRWKTAMKNSSESTEEISLRNTGRRNSVKRGSIGEDDPEIAAKKLRSIIDMMARPSREAQQAYTWDVVDTPAESMKKAPKVKG